MIYGLQTPVYGGYRIYILLTLLMEFTKPAKLARLKSFGFVRCVSPVGPVSPGRPVSPLTF